MTPTDLLDFGCEGATTAVLIRWLLRLDVEAHTAALLGAVGRVLGAWYGAGGGEQLADGVPTFLPGLVVGMALLGVAQLIRGR